MNREEFAKICEARDVLCAFCEVQECEKCIVTKRMRRKYFSGLLHRINHN